MRTPSDAARGALQIALGAGGQPLTFLGGGREDSDGIVYACGDRALKIVSLPADDEMALARSRERMAFARHLGEHGISVAHPMPLANGELYVSLVEGDTRYLAYLMPRLAGRNPAPEDMDARFYAAWGLLTGRAHRVATRCEPWKNLRSNAREYGYQDEIDGFIAVSGDDWLRGRWREMRARLDAMPKTRENYGFTQNDNHMMNVLLDGERLSLIDFDVANCHFFASDIATMPQHLYFGEAGGFCGPVGDGEALRRALGAFLGSYAKEHEPDTRGIADFIAYRRVLLYTVMQGFLRQNPALDAGFRKNIEEEPKLF